MQKRYSRSCPTSSTFTHKTESISFFFPLYFQFSSSFDSSASFPNNFTMSVIGEAALSVFLELLFDKLASSALNYIADYKQVHEQLKEWEKKLPDIQAMLNDAEQKQITNKGVKKWLADLQDLAYDVDDILDEFAYEALRLKLQKNQAQASTSKVRKLIPTCCTSCFTPASFMFNNAMVFKIKKITDRLSDLETRRSSLGLSEIIMSEGNKGMKERLQPTCVMDETVEYVGRDNEKLEMLELLKSGNGAEDGVSVITIVGTGGMGKTTLAQLVFNDASIKDSFDHMAWVCVSNDFDATKITKTILEFITNEPCNYDNLSLLQVKLKENLSEKRFLLVLDDIWNESYEDWTILRSPFGAGTKIIVTTRLQNVSSIVDAVKAFHLDKLSYDDCLSIFTQHALRARDFNGRLEFKEVGENIVRRCNGLPLAAKAIGGLLRTIRDPDAWENIYKSEIWDLPEDQCGVIPVLRLSYHHLPPHLKRCFAYCSILPKDYEFDEEEIILLWRAEGLLNQKAQSEIKDFGNKCFRELISRSFFQKSGKDKSRFVMHDLINDLAQSVAGDICSKMEDNKQQKFSNRTRHSSYVGSMYDGVKKFEAFDEVNYLRTFLPSWLSERQAGYLTSFVVDHLLRRLGCLRILSLKGYWITELPDFFEDLKHLRYLNFSHSKIKCLPDSLCTLYHLETLILKECWELEKLPSNIGNLTELHYLDITGPNSIKTMPFGVGKLTSLQRLSNFILGEGDGHHIRELRNLSNLKGDFCLSGLQHIIKHQDAREAMLNEKSGIDRLELQWRTDFENDTMRNKEVEERVLDFLHPQKKLQQLIIKNFGGEKFPAWISDSSFKNLLSLELRNCKHCKSLPSIGKLSLLKDLSIGGFNEVDKVGVELFGENQRNAFASLETLSFCAMPNWKEWDPCEGDVQVSRFPNLGELFISKCPQLSGRLPTHLPSLRKLDTYRCRRLVVSISSFPSLCELKINGCEELVDECCAEEVNSLSLQSLSLSDISKLSISSERIMSRFSNLEYFRINDVKELVSLSQKGLGLVGHRWISITNCPQLESLETEEVDEEKLHSSGIQMLTIKFCERLNRLPKVLHALKFLTEMLIVHCPGLVCFAVNNLPPTLMILDISDCENLQHFVDERENKSISSNTLCLLEYLKIERCPSLICISSKGDTLSHLRHLKVEYCSKLTSLFLNAKLPVRLKQLFIWICGELECIAQDFHETTGLESIGLWKCDKIKSLPPGLNKLRQLKEIKISMCSNMIFDFEEIGLPPATNLRVFSIEACQNFGALPICINNFTSLLELTVRDYSADISFPEEGFPTNLRSLAISKAPKLYGSLVEWGLDRLTSLQSLDISGEGCLDVVSFPEKEMMLPRSLTDITIVNFENLEYMLSKGFQDLTTLQSLSIYNCSKLRVLPEKDMLLSLGRLWIRNCPLLKEELNLKRDKGREWSKISHIPHVEIDYEWFIPQRDSPNINDHSSSAFRTLLKLTYPFQKRVSNVPNVYWRLVEWGLDRLTSLQCLDISIEGCSDVSSSGKGHASLTWAAMDMILSIANRRVEKRYRKRVVQDCPHTSRSH
ncbi:hypothetical protein REPUB_Repub11eG0044600 [Reevesia pubescens]